MQENPRILCQKIQENTSWLGFLMAEKLNVS
jgi:hypothetical protein